MSDTIIKNKDNYDELCTVSNKIKNYVNEYGTELFLQLYSTLEKEVLIKLKSNCNEGFAPCEEIYRFLERLINIYEKSLKIYDEIIAGTEIEKNYTALTDVKTIIRIQYDKFTTVKAKSSKNPLEAQKLIIFDEESARLRNLSATFREELRSFAASFDSLEKGQYRQYLEPITIVLSFVDDKESLADLYPVLMRIILKEKHDSVHKFYEEFMLIYEAIISRLGSIDITSYYEILKQNYSIISSISRYQIQPLEDELKTTDQGEETDAIRKFLDSIGEGYEYYDKEYQNIEKHFNDKYRENNFDILTYTDFTEILIHLDVSNVNNSVIPHLKKEISPILSSAYSLIGRILTNPNDIVRKNNNHSIEIDDIISISSSISSQFQSISQYYKKNEDDLDDTDVVDILKGIKETIDIKIETMLESDIEFRSESLKLLKILDKEEAERAISLGEKASTNLKEEAEAVYMPIFKALIELISMTKKEPLLREHVFELVSGLASDIAIEPAEEKPKEDLPESHTGELLEKWNKHIFVYKRDYLFYELRSFDEIMMHSISRLRNEPDTEVKKFVFRMDVVNMQINDILAQNKVAYIDPEPNSKFNSKEHEVLMSERSEGFVKGDIIRVLNKGYIHNKEIILRANVIAAK